MARSIPVVALVLLAAAQGWAQDTLGARLRQWRAEIEGDFQADDNLVPGSDINLHSQLNLEDEADMTDIGVLFGLPGIGRINFQYFFGEFDGDATLSNDITFGGTTFVGGTNVSSSMEWKVMTIMIESGVPGAGLTGATTGMGIGIKYFDFDLEISGSGVAEKGNVKGIVPVVGARARYPLTAFLFLEAELNGLFISSIASGGIEATILDASVALQAGWKSFYGGVGWRVFQMAGKDDRADVDEIEVDIELQGFFFEAGIRF